jgi:hypothetical protein
MFENKLLRRIFWTSERGSEMRIKKITNEVLCNFHSSPDLNIKDDEMAGTCSMGKCI